jgi:hypothetical protein
MTTAAARLSLNGEIIDKHCSFAAMRRWRDEANGSALRRKKLQGRR